MDGGGNSHERASSRCSIDGRAREGARGMPVETSDGGGPVGRTRSSPQATPEPNSHGPHPNPGGDGLRTLYETLEL